METAMKNTILAIVAVSLLAYGCVETVPAGPPESCDDGNPCTIDAIDGNECSHDYVTYGEPCIDAPGFCDVFAVCRTECEPAPCMSATVQVPNGCVYEAKPNGWTCTDTGLSGVCSDGVCVALNACSSATACDVMYTDPSGSCVTESYPGCAPCSDNTGAPGTSRNGGACCTGCWAGLTCRNIPNELACGSNGGFCTPCDGAEMCVSGECRLNP